MNQGLAALRQGMLAKKQLAKLEEEILAVLT